MRKPDGIHVNVKMKGIKYQEKFSKRNFSKNWISSPPVESFGKNYGWKC